jgi:hypothetical protein
MRTKKSRENLALNYSLMVILYYKGQGQFLGVKKCSLYRA